MTRFLTIALLCYVLAGCSAMDSVTEFIKGDEDNADPPAPLVEFRQRLNVVELWSENTGKGTDEQYLMLSPVVAQQRLFVVDARGDLQSLDATNGNDIWSTNINSGSGAAKKRFWSKADESKITGGPGYGENTILVGTNEGELITMDSRSGDEIWRKTLTSEILSAPQKQENIIVARTMDGKVVGLNGESGNRIWIYERPAPSFSLRGTSTPVIYDGVVITGFDGGRLTALDLNTGRLLWEVRITTSSGTTVLDQLVDIDTTPIITDGTIYVASYQGHIAAVQLETGRVIWNRDISSYAGFSVDAENVYLADDDSHVWAFDRYTGTPLWEQDKLHARAVTSPANIGDYLVVGDFEGYLHWMSKETGEFVARTRPSKSPYIVGPIVVGQFLYAYCSDGELAAYTIR